MIGLHRVERRPIASLPVCATRGSASIRTAFDAKRYLEAAPPPPQCPQLSSLRPEMTETETVRQSPCYWVLCLSRSRFGALTLKPLGMSPSRDKGLSLDDFIKGCASRPERRGRRGRVRALRRPHPWRTGTPLAQRTTSPEVASRVRLAGRRFTRASELRHACGRSGAPAGRGCRTRRSTIPGGDGP
jgi:hypothetical protein